LRLKLTLLAQKQAIPINYQHFLTSGIYDYLKTGSTKFSANLHNSTNFKFFTFSWLQFPQKQIINSLLKILSSEFYWYISSPWEEFVRNLVNGLLESGTLRIGEHNFPITQTETLPDIIASGARQSQTIKLSCLSPIVITTKKEYKGKLAKYYYKPADNPDEISDKIRQNLLNKYESFYGKKPEDTSLKIEFDKNYLKKPGAQVLSHYIKNNLDIKIPAIMCPFAAIGSSELIRFGYECGFGELNSAGFGMVRVI